MKRIEWVILAVISMISCLFIKRFYPSYDGGDFLLFTDFTVAFFFLPAYYFIFMVTLPLIISVVIKNKVVLFTLGIASGTFALIRSFTLLYFYSFYGKLTLMGIGLSPVIFIGFLLINVKMSRIIERKVTSQ